MSQSLNQRDLPTVNDAFKEPPLVKVLDFVLESDGRGSYSVGRAKKMMTFGCKASLDPGVALRLALLTHGGLAIARSANSRDLALAERK